ncbi:rifin [Plasmodium reichenowi]|uniref:Rifin n=1 Tax=Plasmodium reichenowi TaxID=5854 RepID=A0A060RLZ3_PLARE|nr:rifin [Plasmodium reichenowi]
MKLHYSNILLFVIPLNILAHNKNKLHITPHHTQANRSLCECDTQSSIYDKNADIKSVKEIFDRQTSQRFEEYEERMKDKRQKRKEERHKNIEKIIQKDKMDKSLAEKVEKGCFRCGCGLGGVAASIGLFGGLGIYGWKIAATAAAIEAAKEAGIEAGVNAVIAEIKGFSFIRTSSLVNELPKFINGLNYNTVDGLVDALKVATASIDKPCPSANGVKDQLCSALTQKETWFGRVVKAAKSTTECTTAAAEITKLDEVGAASSYAYSAVVYSVISILIIVLIMIIIYLILRYRRKKKVNKKAQYTKLLNQ